MHLLAFCCVLEEQQQGCQWLWADDVSAQAELDCGPMRQITVKGDGSHLTRPALQGLIRMPALSLTTDSESSLIEKFGKFWNSELF